MSKPPTRWRTLLPVAALLALALWLRWLPLEHGLPRNYLPDTHAVRAALGMAKDKDLVPPVGKYSTYPYLMPYLLLPVYGAQYALGKLEDRWQGAEEFGAVVADHPERAALPARALVAVFGALTALAVYGAARAAGMQRGALAAMFLTATGLLHVQLSVQERPWVIVVFFGALCLWACVDYGQTRRARSLVLSGAFAGLAFAAHQAGLFFALLTAATWACTASGPDDWTKHGLARRARPALFAALACIVVGLVCGHGYYLAHGAVDEGELAGGVRAAEHLNIGGQALRIGFSWSSFVHLGKALAGYDPVLLGLGSLGMVLAWRTRCLRGPFLFTAVYAVFFLFNPSDHVRYLLPLTVLLALAAGAACELAFQRPQGVAAIVALCAVPLFQATRLAWLLRQEDTRAEAERRLDLFAEEAGPEFHLAIDHYGPQVDLSRVALEELAQLRTLRRREEHRLERLKAGGAPSGGPGVRAIFLEELFGFDDATGTYGVDAERRALAETPAQMLDALKITHVLLVNRRPAHAAEPPLSPLASGWTPVWTIDPSRQGPQPAPEALLPTEMDFPLAALWRVERPGPAMTLYALPAR